MAKPKSEPVALVKMDQYGIPEARFGKGDKVLKFAVSRVAKSAETDTGWKITQAGQMPEGVLFVGVDGSAFVADFSRYPDSVKGYMTFHGAKQKIGDEYADLDDVADCMEAARELDMRLAAGKWTADREGFAGISVLMRAIMKVFAIPEEAAREFLKPLSTKEKQALRASEELKATIAELEAAKGKGVDTAEILKKLKPAA